MLPTRDLGTTGWAITTVGFGAWAIGGGHWSFGWGGQEDSDSIEAIRHAVNVGVNWIDTAAVYGLGHSEEVVARALEPIPPSDRPFVFTKCGLRWDEEDPMAPARRIGRARSIRQDAEDSLRRLGADRLDLLQMHWPSEDGSPVEEYWSAMLALKEEGKVAAVGLSNHSQEQVAAAETLGHVDCIQPPLSLIVRDAAAGLIGTCQAKGTGVIVYSPMQSGLLTGAFSAERVAGLPANDWRKRSPQFTGDALGRNLTLAEALIPVARRHSVTPAAVAVAWTLAWPGVTAAIVGARHPGQVDTWLPAAGLVLTGEDLDDLQAAIAATHAGSGPPRPPHQ